MDQVRQAERTDTFGIELPEPEALQLRDSAASEPRRPQVVQPLDEPRAGRALAVERVLVRHSEQVAELFGAMAAAQGMFEDIDRTRTARIQSTRANYTFDYETLADVIAATKRGLSENGLSVMQFPFPGQHSVTLRTLVGHKSGQWIYNDLTAAITDTDPKSVASGITYLCRYARKAILGIAAEWDDDAEAATPVTIPKPAQRKSDQPSPATGGANASVVTHVVVEPAIHAGRVAHIGLVSAIDERANGAMVTLDTGFRAATRDAEVVKSLKVWRDTKATVELRTSASSNPAKFAPVIDEIILRKREPGEDG